MKNVKIISHRRLKIGSWLLIILLCFIFSNVSIIFFEKDSESADVNVLGAPLNRRAITCF